MTTLNEGQVSIHAPGRGATKEDGATKLIRSGFNSRTREGCDRERTIRSVSASEFQFTHPGGVRLALSQTLGG